MTLNACCLKSGRMHTVEPTGGFSLIETLAALAILGAAVVLLLALSGQALRSDARFSALGDLETLLLLVEAKIGEEARSDYGRLLTDAEAGFSLWASLGPSEGEVMPRWRLASDPTALPSGREPVWELRLTKAHLAELDDAFGLPLEVTIFAERRLQNIGRVESGNEAAAPVIQTHLIVQR